MKRRWRWVGETSYLVLACLSAGLASGSARTANAQSCDTVTIGVSVAQADSFVTPFCCRGWGQVFLDRIPRGTRPGGSPLRTVGPRSRPTSSDHVEGARRFGEPRYARALLSSAPGAGTPADPDGGAARIVLGFRRGPSSVEEGRPKPLWKPCRKRLCRGGGSPRKINGFGARSKRPGRTAFGHSPSSEHRSSHSWRHPRRGPSRRRR